MSWKPLNDVIFVKPDKNITYDGPLVIPENNSIEKISPFATVISMGSKCKYPFKKGQRILIEKFRGKPMYIEMNKKKYRIIKEDYVHAVIE